MILLQNVTNIFAMYFCLNKQYVLWQSYNEIQADKLTETRLKGIEYISCI